MRTDSLRRVLIIDDDALMASMLKRMLTRAGAAEVAVAGSGSEALQDIAAHAPSLILCDLNMPGMDGLAFVRHLAAVRRDIDLILMSASDRRILGTARQLAQAHGLRVIGTLGKPIAMAALSEIIAHDPATGGEPLAAVIDALDAEQIRAGLRNGAVGIYYQPQVDAHDGSLRGFEALLRWNDPQRGALPPDAIVPEAERAALISPLTLAIIDRVLTDLPSLLARNPELTVSVNVSADSLGELDFSEQVLERLERHGVDPASLTLEVTESRLIENIVRPAEVLSRLRMKGIGLAVDDYGIGASTMKQLQLIPANELKIDRTFVKGATHDAEARAMLQSAVELGRRLGLLTVAEGVETAQELALVRELGCDRVQGYLVQPAMPIASLLQWMARWTGDWTADSTAGNDD